jgi:biofilm PGA synthesis protein PgaA
MCLLATPSYGQFPGSDWSHDQAIEAAREGRTAEALFRLQALYEETPTDELRRDLLVVAHWHGYDRQAQAWGDQLEAPEQLPRYALVAWARSLRNTGDLVEAEQRYRQCVDTFDQNRECQIGLALVLAESGQVDAGREIIALLIQSSPDDAALYGELGYIERLDQDWLAAADAYLKGAERADDPVRFRRDQLLSQLDMGAPILASELAEQHPEVVDEDLGARVKADVAARHINWVDLPAEEFSTRIERIERAEASLDEAMASGQTPRRGFFDQLLLLDRYNRPDRVIKALKKQAGKHKEPPDYVRSVVAGAYLSERQPEQALEQIDAMSPEGQSSFDVQAMKVYALEENEQFPQALALADEMVEQQPIWRRYPGLRQPQPNPLRVRADRLAAMMRAYGARLDEAYDRLQPLVNEAPLHEGLRTDLAAVVGWRGWTRSSEEHYRMVLSYSPDNIDAQLGLANRLADQGMMRESMQVWQGLEKRVAGWRDEDDGSSPLLSESIRLRRAWGDFERLHGWAFDAQVDTIDSDGFNITGERSWHAGASLTSPLSMDGYRWQLGSDWWRADFPEGRGASRVDRLELHRRRRDWHGFIGWHQDSIDTSASGPHAQLAYHPNDIDTWRVRAAVNDWEAPLRGRVQDVNADSLSFSYDRRWSEQTSVGATVSAMDFDDGNLRRSALVAFNQRLYTNHHWQLDGRVDAYASRNREVEATYFNPSQDAALGLGLTINHRLFRDYEHQVRHRLELSAGPYYQEGFGTGTIATVAWRPRWDLTGSAAAFELGLSWRSRLYDGQRENQFGVELLTNWRWK